MTPDAVILVFLNVEFQATFLLSSFTLIKRLFSSSLLSAFRVVSNIWGCGYFSQESWFQLVIHPARHFAWYTLHISYKEAGWQYIALTYSFPNLNQSVVPCPVLVVAYWPAYRFFRRQVSGLVFLSLRILQSFLWSTTVKGFRVVSEAEVGIFFWNSLAFSMIPWILAIWFLVPLPSLNPTCTSGSSHVLLKPKLKDFEHILASMWDECNCMVVWTFFGIALLCDWNENWPFPVLCPLLSFPDLLTYWSSPDFSSWPHQMHTCLGPPTRSHPGFFLPLTTNI